MRAEPAIGKSRARSSLLHVYAMTCDGVWVLTGVVFLEGFAFTLPNAAVGDENGRPTKHCWIACVARRFWRDLCGVVEGMIKGVRKNFLTPCGPRLVGRGGDGFEAEVFADGGEDALAGDGGVEEVVETQADVLGRKRCQEDFPGQLKFFLTPFIRPRRCT